MKVNQPFKVMFDGLYEYCEECGLKIIEVYFEDKSALVYDTDVSERAVLTWNSRNGNWS